AHFVMPPAIVGDAKLEATWTEQMDAAQKSYVALVESLMERYAWVGDKVHRRKMAREAARGVLPNSTEDHRDKNRRHGKCASVAHDARAPIERRRRAGDSPMCGGDHPDSLGGS